MGTPDAPESFRAALRLTAAPEAARSAVLYETPA